MAHSGVLAAVVDHDVGAEGLGRFEAGVGLVDGDDVGGAVELGAEDGGQADGPGADDGDDVAGVHLAVAHADLVAGREDVGEHQELLVGSRRRGRGGWRCRRRARGRTRPGCRRSCGRGSSRPRRGTARSGPSRQKRQVPHAVMQDTTTRSPRRTVFTPVPDGFDGADGFVAEDAAVDDRGDVALEDVEVGAADGGGVDAHDGVGVARRATASGTSSQAF